MNRRRLWFASTLALTVLALAGPASAQQLRTFSTVAEFNAAAGDQLTCQTFEELEAGSVHTTLSYPGLSVDTTDEGPNDIEVVPRGLFPNIPSQSIDARNSGHSLLLNFSPAVTAFATDLMSVDVTAGPGPGTEVTVTVVFTDATSQSFVVVTPADGPAFFGAVATSGMIQRVVVAPASHVQIPLVDNVCYGQAVTPPPPTGDPFDKLAEALADGRENGQIRRLGTSLEAKLRNAKAAVARGNNAAAIDMLGALANEVQSQSGRHIDADYAALLLGLIQDAIDSLG
jgi:hypothetical protein